MNPILLQNPFEILFKETDRFYQFLWKVWRRLYRFDLVTLPFQRITGSRLSHRFPKSRHSSMCVSYLWCCTWYEHSYQINRLGNKSKCRAQLDKALIRFTSEMNKLWFMQVAMLDRNDLSDNCGTSMLGNYSTKSLNSEYEHKLWNTSLI